MFNRINSKETIVVVIIAILIIFLVVTNITKNKEEMIIENIEENYIEPVKEEGSKIIIHITGYVNNPGVIEIDEGSRIIDVINLAGGLTEEADTSKINLAYKVKDAQKIYIPSIYDEELEYISTENGKNVIVEDKEEGRSAMININSATQTELETLPGIGPSTALKIIDYREQKGKFKSIEEIKEVPGIGDSKFNNIKDMLEI